MRTRLFLLLAFVLVAGAARAQTSPAGNWSGTLNVGQPLELILRVAEADSGFAATLDVPAQGAFGLPASQVDVRNDSLIVTVMPPGLTIALAIAAPDSLHGLFMQGMAVLPLTMTPAEPLRRPQTPVPPLPYVEEAVSIESVPGTVTLAGTYARPAGGGPFPSVLLVTGSGPQDRDETLFGHRPFAVLADALARNGIASLRLDDRGTGASTGDYAAATLDDLLADARAAAGWLAARAESGSVGAIGHSEGGITAVRLAADLDFVVALAAPAVRGAELYVLQQERVVQQAGLDSTDARAFGRAIGAALAPLLAEPAAPDSVLAPAMSAAFNEGLRPMGTRARAMLGLAGPTYAQAREALVGFLLSPGFRSFVSYDPGPALAAVRVPTLMLYGGRDVQVAADQNAPVARTLLGSVPGAEVIVVDEANHLFQTAETGAIAEYGLIEETMAPATIERVAGWIRDLADGMEAGTAR